MTLYSHSRLSTYEGCPLRYRLYYRDKIKRETETVEAFLGLAVHQVLRKCYKDLELDGQSRLDRLLAYYERLWWGKWHDAIVVARQDMTPDDYRKRGRKMIETYYQRYAPFDSDTTIATEKRVGFSLDEGNKYRLVGYIDRLSQVGDDVYRIHDYKTSAYLPGQEDLDNDRQLGLYHIGISQAYPEIRDVRLIWHYLAFDKELVSRRSEEAIARLIADTTSLIDEIEAAEGFPPRESAQCRWCEYPDLCPLRKHLYEVAAPPGD